MRGIDTNVLVRFVVQDDKRQSAIASRLIEKQCSSTEPALISLVVLCEFVWVLSKAYKYQRREIAAVLKQVLVTECFHVSKYDVAWGAMLDYTIEQGDYAGYIIARLNEQSGAETTLTFDKRVSKNKRFTLLSD